MHGCRGSAIRAAPAEAHVIAVDAVDLATHRAEKDVLVAAFFEAAPGSRVVVYGDRCGGAGLG
jgi:hypothetical protein